MAKPILRLGPIDELDDEFDPLLGRSVRDEPAPSASSSAAPLDPDQSVFDEPEPVADDAWVEPIAPSTVTPREQTDQPSLLDWMESPIEEKAPESVAEQEPEPLATEEPNVAQEALSAPVDERLIDPAPIEAEPVEALAEPQAEPEEVAAEPAELTVVSAPPVDEIVEADPEIEEAPAVEPETDFTHADALEPQAEPAEAQVVDAPPFAGAVPEAEPLERPKGPSRAALRRANMKRSPIGRRKAAQKLAATVAGTTLFAIALFFTLLSFLAPLGYPFDAVSSYRWYWTFLAFAAGLSWAAIRGRNMIVASAIVGAINLFVILPSLGAAPKGGQISNAVVAWANVAGDEKALDKVLREAEHQKAGLVLIAKAPASILTPPPGWNVVEQPNFADPTGIAVLSRGRWQSATIPGEPTIARTAAGDLTIIATLPPPSNGGKGVGAARESQLNRAAVRAGDQDGPVAVLGDFGVAPWDGAMSQFRKYGNVTRVRCGGFMGTTVSQAFGLVGVTHDHAFVRDVKVTHCRLGGSLNNGGHRAIYLYLAPLDAPN
jgi:endonuclease/exonuclease/phosphatase (EEP) superfamily protein YafD